MGVGVVARRCGSMPLAACMASGSDALVLLAAEVVAQLLAGRVVAVHAEEVATAVAGLCCWLWWLWWRELETDVAADAGREFGLLRASDTPGDKPGDEPRGTAGDMEREGAGARAILATFLVAADVGRELAADTGREELWELFAPAVDPCEPSAFSGDAFSGDDDEEEEDVVASVEGGACQPE